MPPFFTCVELSGCSLPSVRPSESSWDFWGSGLFHLSQCWKTLFFLFYSEQCSFLSCGLWNLCCETIKDFLTVSVWGTLSLFCFNCWNLRTSVVRDISLSCCWVKWFVSIPLKANIAQRPLCTYWRSKYCALRKAQVFYSLMITEHIKNSINFMYLLQELYL